MLYRQKWEEYNRGFPFHDNENEGLIAQDRKINIFFVGSCLYINAHLI